jgi:hypothetical protein
LIEQTVKTLSDMKTTSEDEAQLKYETVVATSLKALELFFRYTIMGLEISLESSMPQSPPPLSPSSSSSEAGANASRSALLPINSIEKLKTIFENPKFWKFSKDNTMKV